MAKAGKAEIAKARASLTQERLRLKEGQIHLEREWQKLQRAQEKIAEERRGAIAYLRRLCERWGDNDWPDDLPLAEILEDHLADHLAEGMERVRRHMERLSRAMCEAEAAPPQRPRLVTGTARPVAQRALPAPDEVAKVLPVRGSRGGAAYQAVCSCRWSGVVRASEAVAQDDRQRHARSHAGRLGVAR
jgi:hypothetical protein